MLGLPVTTHRYLIQPLAGRVHVKQVFAQRFLKFCDKLKNSKKAVIKDTFNKIKLDVRTTTGKNLAEFSELVNKPVTNLSYSDASEVTYEAIDDEQKYRIDFIQEIIDVRNSKLDVDGFSEAELDQILEHLCTS